jgi:hypothetical protein
MHVHMDIVALPHMDIVALPRMDTVALPHMDIVALPHMKPMDNVSHWRHCRFLHITAPHLSIICTVVFQDRPLPS